MPTEPLPSFKYHPDPVGTGSVKRSETPCACCGRTRGYIYVGPVYSEKEYRDCICPWCVADGSAHAKLGVSFHDDIAVPGADFIDSPPVSEEVVAEVCHRTPGFCGWQQEQWFTCCSDAGAFLGRAGRKELKAFWPEAIPALRRTAPDDDWDEFFRSLSREGSPSAYVFQCLHCGRYGAYWDCD